MSKFGKGFLLLALVVFLALSSPCWARKPGTFARVLKNQLCGGTSGAEWYGCFAYMHYRVDYSKNKNSAKSACYSSGCGGKYGQGVEFNDCKKGCDHAYDADTE